MRMFGFFGKKSKYNFPNWWENFMSGHLNIGPITIYGANGMCWAVNIRTKRWGYICFTLPSIRRSRMKKHEGHYFYLSPNGTPWASTFYRGKDRNEKIRAEIRKMNFGHGFNTQDPSNKAVLRCINDNFENFILSEYELSKHAEC